MVTPQLRALIDAVAAVAGLPTWEYRADRFSPGELLEGLVLAESGGDPKARRYEPHQDRAGRTDAATDPDRPGIDDLKAEDDASYGLCQVMGSTWRLLVGAPVRAPLDYELLFEPTFALAAGAEVLCRELHTVRWACPDEAEADWIVRALCRFNGGPTGDDPDSTGDVRRRVYVEHVAENARRAQADRRRA
jgi:hypothetical protein